VENLFVPELNEAAVAAIATATQDAPQRFRAMIGQYHGAMTRVRPSDSGGYITEEEIARDITQLEDSHFMAPSPIMWAAWGQRASR